MDYLNVVQKSGLSATKATHIVYKIPSQSFTRFYSIPVDRLKQLIRNLKADGKLKTVWGGDNNKSQLVLLPLILLRNNSKQLTSLND